MSGAGTPAIFRGAAGGVSAMFFLNGALFGAWAARVPWVKERFQLSAEDLGLLLLLMGLGAIALFPVAGAASDRAGAARVTRRIGWCYGVSLVLVGAAPSVWTLAAAVCLFGAMHGGMDVAMNAWGAEVERKAKRPLMSGFHAVFSFGAGVGALSGALAARAELDAGAHFALSAVLFTPLAAWLARKEWRSEIAAPSRVRSRPPVFALPKGGLVWVGVAAAASAMNEGAMADWSAVFLVETVAASESAAALGYAAFSTTMVLVRFFGGEVVARLGAVRTVRISGVFALAGILTAIWGGAVWTVCAGFALSGVGLALVFPLAFSRAANEPGQSAGAAIAGVATFGYGGLLLGPPIIGFVAERTSLESGFLVLAALAVVIVAFAGTFRPAPISESEAENVIQ